MAAKPKQIYMPNAVSVDCDRATSWQEPSAQMAGDDLAFLRGSKGRAAMAEGLPLSWVDLFAGCGAMSLGVSEAIAASGFAPRLALGVDVDANACAVYAANFPGAAIRCCDIQQLLGSISDPVLSPIERELRSKVGDLDLLVGGPPCQGHSDLNNYSRRHDGRNDLYTYMARAAHVFRPRALIVENVQGVPHAKSGVVDQVTGFLRSSNYTVECRLLDASDFGVPQRRRRHVMFAWKGNSGFDLDAAINRMRLPSRSVRWAFEDLRDVPPTSLLDQRSSPSPDNRKRIRYLYENGIHDLPNSQRPPCHRDKVQSYNSVYGRMHWDRPAQTVTSGFYSMCMGRYVHPDRESTITAHEAARLQAIPDSFNFTPVRSRTHLATMIANAVPPKLAYVIASAMVEGIVRR